MAMAATAPPVVVIVVTVVVSAATPPVVVVIMTVVVSAAAPPVVVIVVTMMMPAAAPPVVVVIVTVMVPSTTAPVVVVVMPMTPAIVVAVVIGKLEESGVPLGFPEALAFTLGAKEAASPNRRWRQPFLKVLQGKTLDLSWAFFRTFVFVRHDRHPLTAQHRENTVHSTKYFPTIGHLNQYCFKENFIYRYEKANLFWSFPSHHSINLINIL